MKRVSQNQKPAERRTVIATRNAIKLAAAIAGTGGASSETLVLNISATGVLLQSTLPLKNGEVVELDLSSAGHHRAKVMWTNGEMVGCEFVSPLSRSRLSAALLKGDSVRESASVDSQAKGPTGGSLLGSEITRARRTKELTQGELAQLVGVSTTTICKWERGKVRPRAIALGRLQDVLGTLPDPQQGNPAGPVARSPRNESPQGNLIEECKAWIAQSLGLPVEAISLQIQVSA